MRLERGARPMRSLDASLFAPPPLSRPQEAEKLLLAQTLCGAFEELHKHASGGRLEREPCPEHSPHSPGGTPIDSAAHELDREQFVALYKLIFPGLSCDMKRLTKLYSDIDINQTDRVDLGELLTFMDINMTARVAAKALRPSTVSGWLRAAVRLDEVPW